LLNATGCRIADIDKIADRYPNARGARRLRSMLELVDGGAESPRESRLRLILVRGGLGPIETQIPVTDGRILRRLEFLAAMGWLIVRVSPRHMRYPQAIVVRAVAALQRRGWSPRLQKMTS
jgi:hypothetical protein